MKLNTALEDTVSFSSVRGLPTRGAFLPSLWSASRWQKPSLTSTPCKGFHTCEILFQIPATFGIVRGKTDTGSLIAYDLRLQTNHEWTLANSWECGPQNVFYVSDWWICYIHLKQWTMLYWLLSLPYTNTKINDVYLVSLLLSLGLVAKARCKAECVYVTSTH